MAQFTTAYAAQRAAKLSPPVTILNRTATQSADELLRSIHDVIGRVLNSDPDAVFHLIRTAIASQIVRVDRAISDLDVLFGRFELSQLDPPIAPSRVQDLVDLLDQYADATTQQRSLLAGRFGAVTKEFANSSQTAIGQRVVRPSQSRSKAELLTSLNDLGQALQELLDNNKLLVGVKDSFTSFTVNDAIGTQYVTQARDLLAAHLESGNDEMGEAILDATLVMGGLQVLEYKLAWGDNKFYVDQAVLPAADGGMDDRTVTVPSSTFPIRIGDYVQLGSRSARVAWVSPTSLTLAPLESLPTSETTTPLKVYPLGLVGYSVIEGVFNQAQTYFVQLLGSWADLSKAMVVLIESGAYSTRLNELDELRTTLVSYRIELAKYQASTVQAVTDLLEHLDSERLHLVVECLESLQFDKIYSLPEILSSQATVSATMNELVADALDGMDESVAYAGQSTLDIWYSTGGK